MISTSSTSYQVYYYLSSLPPISWHVDDVEVASKCSPGCGKRSVSVSVGADASRINIWGGGDCVIFCGGWVSCLARLVTKASKRSIFDCIVCDDKVVYID